MNKLSIWRGSKLLQEKAGESDVQLYYRGKYKPGDEIRVACDTPYIELQVDQAMMPARLYVPSGEMVYRLPLSGDDPDVYPPGAFAGDGHVVAPAGPASRLPQSGAQPCRSAGRIAGIPAHLGQCGDPG